MKKSKTQKGITLVALIITIIILLILAVVAIRSITGDGIFQKAREASDATARAQAQEELDLAVSNLKMEEIVRKNMTQEEKAQWLQSELQKQDGNAIVNTNGNGFTGTYKDYIFTVDENYKVTIGEYAGNGGSGNNNQEEPEEVFNPEEWDQGAAPDDVFIWKSDDPNSPDYGVVIGYTANIDNYPILRFPSRCTKITWEHIGHRYYLKGVDGDCEYSRYMASRGYTNNIKKLEIPGTVESVFFSYVSSVYAAFLGITEVVMAPGVKKICDYSFNNCSNLEKITIPNSVSYIGAYAFNNTAWYNNQPDGVVYAGKVLYSYKGEMPSDTTINVLEGTKGITANAFYECTNLTNITIPDSVSNIGTGAFENTAWYNNQPDGVVYAGKVLHSYKGEMPSNTTINVLEGTKGIAANALQGCKNLTNITIPNTVTNIGRSALATTGISDLTIPDSVRDIESRAFEGCDKLVNVKISNNLREISEWLFSYCTSLSNITIPDNVTSIGPRAFENCKSLSNIIIPEGVVNIGDGAFERCTNISSIIIPQGVENMGRCVFHSWTRQQTIKLRDCWNKETYWSYRWDDNVYEDYTYSTDQIDARIERGYTGE